MNVSELVFVDFVLLDLELFLSLGTASHSGYVLCECWKEREHLEEVAEDLSEELQYLCGFPRGVAWQGHEALQA